MAYKVRWPTQAIQMRALAVDRASRQLRAPMDKRARMEPPKGSTDLPWDDPEVRLDPNTWPCCLIKRTCTSEEAYTHYKGFARTLHLQKQCASIPMGSVCLKVKCAAIQCEQRRHIPGERTWGSGRTSLDLRAVYQTMNISLTPTQQRCIPPTVLAVSSNKP